MQRTNSLVKWRASQNIWPIYILKFLSYSCERAQK
jgi:hypothetical protein